MKDSLFERAEAKIGKEEVQRIVVAVISFMTGHDNMFERFLKLTGLEIDDLRHVFEEEAFQASLLQFLCEKEENLLAFSTTTHIAPAAVSLALAFLSDSDQEGSL